MKDKITGALEVGTNDRGEVVINHPRLDADANGVGHIVFSPNQARHLALCLSIKAAEAEKPHPEDYCQACGGPNVVWFTDSPLWNLMSGGFTVLCPTCFIQRAEKGGFRSTGWKIIPEKRSTTFTP